MQIRLTVLGPRSGRPARFYDVFVTAPAGTPLAAVAGALVSGSGSGQPARASGSTPALYAGAERLDPETAVLGVPPLVDGAVISLHGPADQHADPPSAPAAARLHVVGGPDAGGVHLLQGGQVRIGRSADADVPLDDPDVSRLHCVVTVAQDGLVTVADLRSTNGTAVDGAVVGERPVPLSPGALLRVGESTLRLEPPAAPGGTVPPPPPSVPAIPDAEGHLRISLPPTAWTERVPRSGTESPLPPRTPSQGPGPRASSGVGRQLFRPDTGTGRITGPAGIQRRTPAAPSGTPRAGGQRSARDAAADRPQGGTSHGQGTLRPADPYDTYDAQDRPGRHHGVSGEGADHSGPLGGAATRPSGSAGSGAGRRDTPRRGHPGPETTRAVVLPPTPGSEAAETGGWSDGRVRGVRPGRGAAGEAEGTRGVAGTIGAWARRLATGRPGSADPSGGEREKLADEAAALRDRWPDPAAVLLTALGPGPRLWERGPAHPDTLAVRLGTTDLPAGDGVGILPAVPFAVGLLDPDTFVLGLAGPRPRLAGLARSVLAQAAALHSPASLEIVLISADRSRTAEQRAEEWSWLHWLPHLRPAHGQDCRLLLALDREQAEARTAELVRRLEDGPLGPGWVTAGADAVAEAAAGREGPHTLVVVDGDPGSAALRDTVGRIAEAGPSVGVHLLCLAERPDLLAADCRTVAVLEGDVATTLRIAPHGPERIILDAVSPAWAERFARALAPVREGDAAAPVVRSVLPDTARLLDELDLALATPAKITARWAGAGETAGAGGSRGSGGTEQDRHRAARARSQHRSPSPGGAAVAVLGTGTAGQVLVDLVGEGPHLMAGGAPGSGKTELLRSITAALAVAERPDRLVLVLVDGAGPERGDGLRLCTDLPHVSTYLSASDPLVMREFAQALTAELKRREAELGGTGLGPVVLPRQTSAARADGRQPSEEGVVRLQTRVTPPQPRMVVVVDDFDALVAPALGSTARPAAGSVVRALEAVAREGERLGVHLVASTGRPERTAGTEADERSRLRVALRTEDPESAALLVHIDDPAGLDDTVPGRGYLRRPNGAVTPFQAGRVSGRIPRTATLRPTVVPLDWARMGDPPTRRPVRELGNGPTDLALLASALQRAAESLGADPVPPLL
jgi:hypothetical protein